MYVKINTLIQACITFKYRQHSFEPFDNETVDLALWKHCHCEKLSHTQILINQLLSVIRNYNKNLTYIDLQTT